VGAYVLCLVGHSAATEPLIRLGLVRDSRAQEVSSDHRILALASQRTLEANDTTMLTDRGLRRIGYVPSPAGGEPEAQSQPLFFVPRHMIGSLIGSMIDPMIGYAIQAVAGFTASERPETDQIHCLNRSHGLKELQELHEESPPTPH
jgi:hypothetical protein